MRAIAYTRVSTTAQAETGHSLDEQRERMQNMAAFRGIEEIIYIEDSGVSAATLNRPGIHRIFEVVAGGQIDYVMVTDLDRLTRSVGDLQTLINFFRENGTEFISASESLDTSTTGGRMLVNMLAVFAQWEREMASERVRNVQASLRNEGKAIGNPPYGQAIGKDGYLVPNPDEQRTLKIMRCLRRRGLSATKIASTLTERGHTTRRGTPFTQQGVSHILNRHGDRDPRHKPNADSVPQRDENRE